MSFMKMIFIFLLFGFFAFFAAFGLAVSFFFFFLACCMDGCVCGCWCIALDLIIVQSLEFRFYIASTSSRWRRTKASRNEFSSLSHAFPPSLCQKGRCTHTHSRRCEAHKRNCALRVINNRKILFERFPERFCDGLLIDTTRENGEMASLGLYLFPIIDFRLRSLMAAWWTKILSDSEEFSGPADFFR